MLLGLWSCPLHLGGNCARWDELHMRLQHLALFRGIGSGAYAVNLGNRIPSTRLAQDRLWRLPFDLHRVTVEVAAVFPLHFPTVALRQNRFLAFVNLWKSANP